MINKTKLILENFSSENPDSFIQIGKYFTTDVNDYEFLVYKEIFDGLIFLVIVRWILLTTNQILKWIMKKEILIRVPDFSKFLIIKYWITAFKEYKKNKGFDTAIFVTIEKENPIVYISDILLIMLELRIILAIQLLWF